MRRLAAILLFPLALPAYPQAARNDQYGQLDANLTLFTVTAAINAAGYDAELDSPSNHQLRKALRDYLAQQNIPSLSAIRRFVRDHKPADGGLELSQYVSWALLSKGPPEFTPARGDFPQPPDAAALFELPPLMAQFYQDANIESLWQRVQPYYEEALAAYTDAVAQSVLQVNSFLRAPTSGNPNRRFQIFLELLGAPNQAQTRVYLDDYIIVITPSAEPRVDEIRHHYLHYMADSLGFRHGEELARIRSLGDYALASPILAEQYRNNFTDLATECYIKALEARILRKPAMAEQAMREGFVLTPAFYEGLGVYLAQDRPLDVFFPEMVKGIDMRVEAVRLDEIDFVSERAVRAVRVTVPVAPPELTGVGKTLEEGEDAIRQRNPAVAKDIFNRALAETQERRRQARAYYGLARVAILDRDPETGDQLFRKVLELDPDASTKAWTLLYLGKLADSQGEAEPAREFYRQALAVEGLPDQVRGEAEQGMQGAFRRDPGPRE